MPISPLDIEDELLDVFILVGQESDSVLDLVVTEEDVVEGAEFFTVGCGLYSYLSENTVATILPGRVNDGRTGKGSIIFLNEEGERIYSDDLGITPRVIATAEFWSEDYLTFFNKPWVRKEVVEWQLSLSIDAATGSAVKILQAHPEDYKTELFVLDGQVHVRLKDS